MVASGVNTQPSPDQDRDIISRSLGGGRKLSQFSTQREWPKSLRSYPTMVAVVAVAVAVAVVTQESQFSSFCLRFTLSLP